MPRTLLFVFVSVAVTTLAGCSSSSGSSTGISTVSCPTGSTLSYENFGSAFMTDHCLSCHTSDEQPRLTTDAMVKSNASRILQEAVYTNAMPPDEDVALAERQMLGEWIACGAP